ncbi:haloacid dehalogenase superfamily enzyme, subfamily IA [Thaumarchaeota archaeon SCGC AB-539-E09]|nr:haloacid dehalogenase superfamily enzyme, subfamily IA [Thaumarchaeota archaeon SCGC AB-539-E09]
MNQYMAIKAVILDFGGTLSNGALDLDPYHEKTRSILAGRGHLVEMIRLKKALKGALGDLNRVRMKGKEMTFEDVYDIFLGRLEIPGDRETLDELHDNYRNHLRTDFLPCVEYVLKNLAEKYKVALLSNTMSDQPRLLLSENGFDKYFDLIICSRDLGLRKPNPKLFKYILEKLEVKPNEAVHVGDSVKEDMIGARDSDVTGIWIKTPDQPSWSGYAISSICELPEFLENMGR